MKTRNLSIVLLIIVFMLIIIASILGILMFNDTKEEKEISIYDIEQEYINGKHEHQWEEVTMEIYKNSKPRYQREFLDVCSICKEVLTDKSQEYIKSHNTRHTKASEDYVIESKFVDTITSFEIEHKDIVDEQEETAIIEYKCVCGARKLK